jgi:hypothetical protein
VFGFFNPIVSHASTIVFDDPSGLSAEAIFSLTGSNSLQIILTNTSTAVPSGWDESDQLLTTLYFRLPTGITIIDGSAAISPGSESVNFDATYFQTHPQLVGGADVSVEWGFGNEDHAIDTLPDDYYPFSQVSSMRNHTDSIFDDTVAFNTDPVSNLDGPDENLDGPQAGLTNGLIDLDGLGAIQNSITIQLALSGDIPNLSFLENGTWVEFGSDAAHLPGSPVPIPSAILLLGSGILGLAGLRKKFIGRG